MNEYPIPIDPYNPGQVFACMGFLELSDHLLGGILGSFSKDGHSFILSESKENPYAACLQFIVEAKATEMKSFKPEGDKKGKKSDKDMALPVLLKTADMHFRIDHWEEDRWSDASGRDSMKLYSGNRSAFKIVCSMQDVIQKLYLQNKEELLRDPMNIGQLMSGRFNFDPRSGWTALDMGFSPNEHKSGQFKEGVLTFPAVELFAAIGMQHARPCSTKTKNFSYKTWDSPLPPMLARLALGVGFTMRHWASYLCDYDLAGKNKVLRFSKKEDCHV
jgi:CRISPR-associated protein Csx14